MWASLITSALGSVGGLIAMLVVVASLVSGGAYFDHKIEEAKIATMTVAAAKAHAAAVADAAKRQKELDDATLSAQTTETDRQRRMVATTQAHLAYLRAHPVSIPCMPWGFVRVLNAAITGTPAAGIHIPAGSVDGACSTVDAATLARNLISNFGNANANGEQLTALQAWARSVAKVGH